MIHCSYIPETNDRFEVAPINTLPTSNTEELSGNLSQIALAANHEAWLNSLPKEETEVYLLSFSRK